MGNKNACGERGGCNFETVDPAAFDGTVNGTECVWSTCGHESIGIIPCAAGGHCMQKNEWWGQCEENDDREADRLAGIRYCCYHYYHYYHYYYYHYHYHCYYYKQLPQAALYHFITRMTSCSLAPKLTTTLQQQQLLLLPLTTACITKLRQHRLLLPHEQRLLPWPKGGLWLHSGLGLLQQCSYLRSRHQYLQLAL
jgi:hypothetical protein